VSQASPIRRPTRPAAAPPHRLRILMVLESEFPPRRGGGSEYQVRTLGEALHQRGHRVSVLTPRLIDGAQASVERYRGLAVARLAYPHLRVLGGLVMMARMALFLRRHARHYDVAHVHIAHHLAAVCCLVAPVLGLRTLVKVAGVWELRDGLLRSPGNPLTRALRPLWRRADGWQAVSSRIAGHLAGLGIARERIHAIPNAVDLTHFSAQREPRAAGTPRTLLYVGRLAPEKDLPTLLRAWARVFAGRTDRRLWLVGSGVQQEALERLAGELGCTASITFLGHRDDVADVLAQADAGVLPSLVEGLSNTLLEFMACGLPVLASRVSGSEDLIEPGVTGWLHAPGDLDGLATALRAMDGASDAQLATLGHNARSVVARCASREQVIDRLLAAYTGSVDGDPATPPPAPAEPGAPAPSAPLPPAAPPRDPAGVARHPTGAR